MNNSIAVPAGVCDLIDRFFATPFKLDRNGQPHDIKRSSLQRVEALALASLICELRPKKSLEIGLAEAGSCVAICAVRRHFGLPEPHVALDPFQESLSAGAGLLELERLGLREAVTWLPKRSEVYLHEAWKQSEMDLDFAFVDGGHDVGQKVADAFYLNKVLRPGGVVAFHDALLISTATAVYFLVRECGYTAVALPSDSKFRWLFRSMRHGLRLGWWYSTRIVPILCRSLVALKKPVS